MVVGPNSAAHDVGHGRHAAATHSDTVATGTAVPDIFSLDLRWHWYFLWRDLLLAPTALDIRSSSSG